MSRRSAAVVALLLATQVVAARPAAAATTLPDVPGLDVLAVTVTVTVTSTSTSEVSLTAVVRPTPATPLPDGAVRVTADGETLPTRARPVFSDEAAIGLVLDASDDGAAAAGGGATSGAAGFLLQLPAGARTAVVADQVSPEVLAPTSVGVAGGLRATTGLRHGGGRATSAALTLAVRELPDWPSVQPVVALSTSAPDAGGEPAAALGERLRRDHVVLVVVGTGPDTGYWSRVATATGGLAVTSRPDRTIDAFDTVADALRARYLVTFDRPPGAARADLHVAAGDLRATAAVALPPPARPDDAPTGGGSPVSGWWWWAVTLGLMLLVAGAVSPGVRRRLRAPAPEPAAAPDDGSLFSPTVSPTAAPVPSTPHDAPAFPARRDASTPASASAPTLLPRSSDPRRVPPEVRVLDHRERAWAAQVPDVAPAMIRWTVAAATLAGADTTDEAHALLARHPALAGDDRRERRDRLIHWWAAAAPGPRLLNPLGPERLGQHLVVSTMGSLRYSAGEVVQDLLGSGSDRQVATTLDLLARAHAGHPLLAHLADDAVARQLLPLTRRLTRGDGSAGGGSADGGSADGSVRAALRDALLRLLTASSLSRLIPGDGPTGGGGAEHRATAHACRELAEQATDAGADAAARALADAATRIEAALTTGSAEADRRHQDLRVLEELVVREPYDCAHRRALADVQARLADLDRSEHRPALADAGYRRAIQSLTALVSLDPGDPDHRRDLADAYRRLADLDAGAGWLAQAEIGYARAQEIDLDRPAELPPGAVAGRETDPTRR